MRLTANSNGGVLGINPRNVGCFTDVSPSISRLNGVDFKHQFGTRRGFRLQDLEAVIAESRTTMLYWHGLLEHDLRRREAIGGAVDLYFSACFYVHSR